MGRRYRCVLPPVSAPTATSNAAGSPDWGGASEAVLNAVVGDYLERRGNALAIEMALYHSGRPLPLTSEALRTACPGATAKSAVLVHGMACTESSFSYPDDPTNDYGSQLETERGFT